MLDSDTVIRSPHSANDARTSISMKTLGVELVLFVDDPGRQGPIREVRLLPDGDEPLESGLRAFAPRSPLYVKYARSAMTDANDDWLGSLQALREIGTTRRGLGDEFYRRVALVHGSLVAEGERHPVKALAEQSHVTISAASRWITEARQRGYIADQKG